MPRDKRKSTLQTFQEEISKIDEGIAKHQNRISKLESEKKELLNLRKKQEVDELYTKIRESGKSYDDIVEFLDVH